MFRFVDLAQITASPRPILQVLYAVPGVDKDEDHPLRITPVRQFPNRTLPRSSSSHHPRTPPSRTHSGNGEPGVPTPRRHARTTLFPDDTSGNGGAVTDHDQSVLIEEGGEVIGSVRHQPADRGAEHHQTNPSENFRECAVFRGTLTRQEGMATSPTTVASSEKQIRKVWATELILPPSCND